METIPITEAKARIAEYESNQETLNVLSTQAEAAESR
jgi:hypothetical protein